ncbi:MAG: hypothetical protein PVF73_02330 [Bacteroidales bacterium]|jgi:hypothetical protein
MTAKTQQESRPTFLTVICIISFIGLGITVINNLASLAFGAFSGSLYSLIQGSFEQALNDIDATDPAASAFVEQIFDSILKLFEVMPLLAGISLILTVTALVGVIFMWNLKKTGFYLFTGAKVIMIFIPMILIGMNFMSAMMAIGTLFVAAVFITLYALNLKAMK